jgi:hypothetical protein
VDFKLSAGVHEDSPGSFRCVDEENGCPTEEYILCGLKQAPSMQAQINYLVCVDEEAGDAPARAQTCAQKFGLPWADVSSCVSGSGAQLLHEAAQYFSSAKDVEGFPTIQIDGKEPWGRDFDTIMSALCQTGITAGACSKSPQSSLSV